MILFTVDNLSAFIMSTDIGNICTHNERRQVIRYDTLR